MAKIKWRNFSGQKEKIDKTDSPSDSARSAWNIDTNRVPGAISKARGFVAMDFSTLLPSGLNIKNIAHNTYLKVWSGDIKVNELWEMVVVEFVGDHGLDWYEFHRKVGTTAWTEPDGNPHYIGYDDSGTVIGTNSVAYEWGGAKAGRCRWVDNNGVLRAACGSFMEDDTAPSTIANTSTSYPLQIRYIDRWPYSADPGSTVDYTINNGWYMVHDSQRSEYNGKCGFGVAGFWRGRSLPYNFIPNGNSNFTFDIQANSNTDNGNFWDHTQRGYSESSSIRYICIPVYDGHQISSLEMEHVDMYEYVTESTAGKTWCTKLKLYNAYGAYAPPHRLTGFNIYRSVSRMGINEADDFQTLTNISFGDYELIATVDSIHGTENIFSTRATASGSGTSWHMAFDIGWGDSLNTNFIEDLYDGMFVRFENDSGVVKEYKITATDVNTVPTQNQMRIYFTSESSPGITNASTYSITINSRWDVDTANETATLYLLDEDIPLGPAPPWIVPNIEVENLPKVDCNYGGHTFFKDMHFVWDIIYDDVRYQNMVRYSYPANNPYAGHDILFRYLIPQGMDTDDEIRGVFNFLDFALIFTKRKIYRYLIGSDGQLEAIGELLWDVGCESIDSMQEYNGTLYWLGNSGGKKTWYYWNPNSGAPQPAGLLNQDTMDILCENTYADSELAQGFLLLHEGKWVLSVPRFTEDEDGN